MTIIHTTDDLIRLLNENDEFRQAVRRHVLSDELIQLPERLAQFETRVETFIGDQQQFNQRVETFIGDQQQFNQRVETFIGDQQQFNAEQRQFNQRMENAIGELRGNVARQVVSTHFEEIADGMGFRYKNILVRSELVQMLFQHAPDALSAGDRRSFFRADLVIEATDSAGAVHYIAVEASYTADLRDTRRARRNAALLNQCSGYPAHAAIASVRNVREVQALIDDGTVYWYALEPDDFTPE